MICKKWVALILALFSSYLLLLSPTHSQIADDWPMYRHDPRHTGLSYSEVPERLVKVNELDISNGISSLVIHKNTVYAIGRGKLFAMDINSGEIIWSCKEYEIGGTPLIFNGRIFFGTHWGEVIALDVTNGRQLWKSDVGGFIDSSPMGIDDKIIIGTGTDTFMTTPRNMNPLDYLNWTKKRSRVIALNYESGRIEWEFQAKGEIGSSPVYSEGKVFVTSHDGTICAIELGNGRKRWESSLGKNEMPSSPVIVNDKIYVNSLSGSFYIFSATTGR